VPKVISIADLADAIIEAMEEYTEEVIEALDAEVKATGNELAKDIRDSAKTPQLTSEYKKGWASQHTKGKSVSASIVHNKSKWQLTHLLEKGHAKVGGGRVAAIPHIAPELERIEKQFEQNVDKIIKGGGSK